MRWVGRCQYHEGEGWVQLAWWPDLLPSLVGLKLAKVGTNLNQVAKAFNTLVKMRGGGKKIHRRGQENCLTSPLDNGAHWQGASGASVASPIRCRRLRAAIGAQSKAHRAANTERIGKRCNAAMRFAGQPGPPEDQRRDTSTMPSPNLLWNTCMPERRPCEGAAFCGGLLRRHLRAGEGVLAAAVAVAAPAISPVGAAGARVGPALD